MHDIFVVFAESFAPDERLQIFVGGRGYEKILPAHEISVRVLRARIRAEPRRKRAVLDIIVTIIVQFVDTVRIAPIRHVARLYRII